MTGQGGPKAPKGLVYQVSVSKVSETVNVKHMSDGTVVVDTAPGLDGRIDLEKTLRDLGAWVLVAQGAANARFAVLEEFKATLLEAEKIGRELGIVEEEKEAPHGAPGKSRKSLRAVTN